MARAIDAEAMEKDLREQYERVFTCAGRKVKPEDYFIERNAVYNADRVKAEQESFFAYLKSRPTIEPKQEWISVKDRLPEEGQLVLCHCVNSYEILRFMNENSWLGVRNADYMKGFVTHWMPLPEPPERDGD